MLLGLPVCSALRTLRSGLDRLGAVLTTQKELLRRNSIPQLYRGGLIGDVAFCTRQ